MASLSRLFEVVSAHEYYSRVLGQLPKEDANGNVMVRCLFHDEAECSLSINVRAKGGVFNCFGCSAKGNLVTFHKAVKGFSTIAEAVQDIYSMFNVDEKVVSSKYIDMERVTKAHSHLLANTSLLEHLETKRGISLSTIKEYKLGSEEDGRLTIPIFDTEGNCLSLRRWLPEYLRRTKADIATKVLGVRGFNQAALYPLEALRESQIILCEGELDSLLLRERGFNAMTPTGGVNTFLPLWVRLFRDKDVVLLYDNDSAGRAAATERLEALYPVVRSIKEVWLEPEETGKDVTDYWKESPGDFVARVQSAIDVAVPWTFTTGDGKLHVVNLYQAARSDLIGKKIKVQARVVGREDAPMAVPHTIRLECDCPAKNCPGCPAKTAHGTKTIVLTPDHPRFIDFITTPAKSHTAILSELFDVNCRTPQFTYDNQYNVEEIRIMPDVDMSDSKVEYTVRTAYYVGYGMSYNETYNFMGTTVVDPRSNVVTHVFSLAESVSKMHESLSANEIAVVNGIEAKVADHLKIFQADSGSARSKLMEIYRDLEQNVTWIVGRQDVLRAVDLLYHSAIGFTLDREPIVKGWLDVLIIGDTQTGKSKTLERYRDFISAGEVYSGENISKAGIIGGYISLTNSAKPRYVLGVWPLNDGRCVCIDEFSGMPSDLVKELTMLRDHGIAESTKQAQRNKYPARVRFGMVSNPRDGRPMKDFPHGVEAVSDLFGNGDADIARVDMVVAVAEEEVDPTAINKLQDVEVPHVYTAELCNLLLRFIWSRRPSHYIFEPEAIALCYSYANTMGETFDSTIPLVLAQSQRVKLARVAAAIAGRLYSSPDNEHILVTREHVDTAYQFLMADFCKPAMGYHTFSALKRRANTLPNPGAVKKLLDTNSIMVYECLVQNKVFQKKTLADYTGESQMVIDCLFRDLIQQRCIGQSRQYYKKSPGFIKFLASYVHPDEHKNPGYDAIDTDVTI